MDYSIFKLGSLIKINKYEFQDGGGSRDKYMIVLSRNDEEAYVIHSLTTTSNKFGISSSNYGCGTHNVSSYYSIPYFFIPSGQIIGEKKFSFPSNTFILFKDNIRKQELSSFDKYLNEGSSRIEFLDTFPTPKLKMLVKCLLKSDYVPFDLIDELEATKDSL